MSASTYCFNDNNILSFVILPVEDTAAASYCRPLLQGYSFFCQTAQLIAGMTDGLTLPVKEVYCWEVSPQVSAVNSFNYTVNVCLNLTLSEYL